MKRFFLILTILLLCICSASADPLVLAEDFAEDINELYDEEDPSYGTFRYSYRYPHIDESEPDAKGINAFYDYLINNELDMYIQMAYDAFEGYDSFTAITYEVKCNNDDCFSVLVKKEENTPDVSRTSWQGHVFLRSNPNPGHTNTLPQYLGKLDTAVTDEWLQDYQTDKTESLIREMVWEMIEDNTAGVSYYEGLSEEDLSHVFFPEESFYVDENGDPVFFINPGKVAPDEEGLITFPIPREDILDELI